MKIKIGTLFLVFAVFLDSIEVSSGMPPKTKDSLENVGKIRENASRPALPPKKRRLLENVGTSNQHANYQGTSSISPRTRISLEDVVTSSANANRQEFNAMHQRSSSVSPPPGFNAMHRGSGSSAPPPRLVPLQRNLSFGKPTKTVLFGLIPIDVWLDEHSRVQEVYMENNHHLLPEYYQHNNVLIRHANCDGVMLIACIAESGKLLAVRPAHFAGESSLTPTPTEWYIHYSQKNFRLTVDPATKTVTAVRLFGDNYIDSAGNSFKLVTVAGIEFYVFTDRNKKITSAVIARPYVYSLG